MRLKEKFYPNHDSNPAYSSRHLLEKAMIRFRNCDTRKSPSRIKSETAAYKKLWKCYPHEYFLYDLYREDCPLKNEEITGYIPSYFYYYLFLPHHNSYKFHLVTDNKLLTEQFFSGLGINQPRTLCRIVNGCLYSPGMQRYSFDAVNGQLSENNWEKVFVKPAEGGGSKGIIVFCRQSDNTYRTAQGIPFDKAFISAIARKGDYIIQPGIVQDPELSRIYPDSVNTCRVITENRDGNVRVMCAMLRLGRGKKDVDNMSAGGISVNIDVPTGRLGNTAISYDSEKYPHHPDTHVVFGNTRISRWDEIQNFARDSAEKIPYFTHLGWDIALTTEGPLAIEVNLGAGIEAQQLACGGLRDVFCIDNPDYYWKNPGKRAGSHRNSALLKP